MDLSFIWNSLDISCFRGEQIIWNSWDQIKILVLFIFISNIIFDKSAVQMIFILKYLICNTDKTLFVLGQNEKFDHMNICILPNFSY